MDFKDISVNLGIVVKHVDLEQPKEGYFVAHGEKDGRPILLKIASKNYTVKIKNFDKEILADKLFKKYNSQHNGDVFKYLDILDHGEMGECVWIIRNFVEGAGFAVSRKAYDELREDLLSDEVFEKIIKNYQHFQEIDFKDSVDTLKEFAIRFPREDKMLGKEYASMDNLMLSYGDFNPGNIIIQTDGDVLFTDFEWLSLDNPMMDVAYFWLFLWRRPDLQKKWIGALVTNDERKEFFKLSVIRMLSTFDWQNEEFMNNERFIERNKKWYHYLKYAQESFESLTQ